MTSEDNYFPFETPEIPRRVQISRDTTDVPMKRIFLFFFGRPHMQLWQEIAALRADVSKVLQSQLNTEATLGQILAAVMPTPAVGIVFIVDGQEITKMQLKDNGTLSVAIAAQDAKGNPTVLAAGAVPAWAVDRADLANITPAADGMSAVVVPVGPLGSFNVQCSIPAVGTEPALAGSLEVDLIAGDATQIALTGTAS